VSSIKYSDLISNDNSNFQELLNAISTIKSELKQLKEEAAGFNPFVTQGQNQLMEQYKKMLALVQKYEKAESDLGDTRKKLEADVNKYKNTLKGLEAQMKLLLLDQKKMTIAELEQTKAGKKLQSQIEQLAATLKKRRTEEKKNINTLNLVKKANTSRLNSEAQLVAQIKLNRAELSMYSNAQIEASATLTRLRTETAQMDAELKKLKGSTRASSIQTDEFNGTIAEAFRKQKRLAAQVADLHRMWKQMPPTVKANKTALHNYNRAVEELNADIKKLGNVTGVYEVQQKRIAKRAGDVGRTIRRLAATYASLFTAFNAAKGIKNTVVELDGLDKAMRLVISDTDDFASSQEFLSRVVEDYGLDLLTTRKAYMRFIAASKSSTLTLKEQQGIFDSVAKSSAALGLTLQRQDLVFNALEQMMSKGKVSSEELRRQLGDSLPGSVEIMAKALGVTTNELDKMLKKGKVLSSEALPKFAQQLEKAYGIDNLEKVDTLAAAQSRFSSEIVRLIEALQSSDALKEFYNMMRSGVRWVRLNIDLVISLAKAIGLVVAASFTFIKAAAFYNNMKEWTKGVKGLSKAQKMLNLAMAANPYALALKAAVALSAVVYGLAVAFKNLSNRVSVYQEMVKKTKEETDELSMKMEVQKEILKDSNTPLEVRKSVLSDLKQQYPKIFGLLKIGKSKEEDFAKAIDEATDAMNRQIFTRNKSNALEELNLKRQKVIREMREMREKGITSPTTTTFGGGGEGSAGRRVIVNDPYGDLKKELSALNAQIKAVNDEGKTMWEILTGKSASDGSWQSPMVGGGGFTGKGGDDYLKFMAEYDIGAQIELINQKRKAAIKQLSEFKGQSSPEKIKLINKFYDDEIKALLDKGSGSGSGSDKDPLKALREARKEELEIFKAQQEAEAKIFNAKTTNEIAQLQFKKTQYQELEREMSRLNNSAEYEGLDSLSMTADDKANNIINQHNLKLATRNKLLADANKKYEEIQNTINRSESSDYEKALGEYEALKDHIDVLESLNEKYSDLEKIDLSSLKEDLKDAQVALNNTGFEGGLKVLEMTRDNAILRAEIELESAEDINKAKLKAERDFLRAKLYLHVMYNKNLSKEELANYAALLEKLDGEINAGMSIFEKGKQKIFDYLGLSEKDKVRAEVALSYMKQTWSQIGEMEREARERASRNAENALQEAQSNLQTQIELDKQGFASNVELAQQQVEVKKKARDEALKNEEKAAARERLINQLTATSNMIVAVSKAFKIGGIAGFGLAAGVLASYAALIVKARSLKRKGTDGVEPVKGTRHGFGGDTPLGYNDGKGDVYAEYGEGHAVFTPDVMRSRGREINAVVKHMQKGIIPTIGTPSKKISSKGFYGDDFGSLIYGELVKSNKNDVEYDDKGRVVRRGKNVYNYA
jgi:tape measure domain-containing protein